MIPLSTMSKTNNYSLLIDYFMKPIKNTPLIAVFAYRSILLVASMLFLLFVPSKGQNRILINQDPNRPEGFYCVDSTGKEIAYITESELYRKSPY